MIKEETSLRDTPEILEILLKDITTKKNIKWATNNYMKYDFNLTPDAEMTVEAITNGLRNVVQPRVKKDLEIQKERTKEKAEVFTPTCIVKKQVDLVNNEFKDLKLEDYINKKWLEITCGEAPYICSRYDTTTGEYIKIEDRVGFLDKKLQRINKESNKEDWLDNALIAIENSYGYEYQGDSLLIARENVLYTFVDYYKDVFNKTPNLELLKLISNIVIGNIVQMNGLTYETPYSKKTSKVDLSLQMILFEDMETKFKKNSNKEAKIKGSNKKTVKLKRIKERKNKMKFDVIIGNPPYQQEDGGAQSSAYPIYQKFVEEGIKLNPSYLVMITPSRWFSGGRGLDSFRNKMLESENIVSIHDFPEASDIFKNVEIKGGVSYFLWKKDHIGKTQVNTYKNKKLISSKTRKMKEEDINIFIRNNDAVDILIKIKTLNEKTFDNIVSSQRPFGLRTYYKGHEKSTKNNIKVFVNKGTGYTSLNEITKNKDLIMKHKVLLPRAIGIGDVSRDIFNPIYSKPNTCCSETYLVIGPFINELESKNVIKFIKTKFFRFLVGIQKNTMMASRSVYSFVPLQNFTNNSDINWSKSISEIDQQLYKKYGLTKEEIDFMETNVREME